MRVLEVERLFPPLRSKFSICSLSVIVSSVTLTKLIDPSFSYRMVGQFKDKSFEIECFTVRPSGSAETVEVFVEESRSIIC